MKKIITLALVCISATACGQAVLKSGWTTTTDPASARSALGVGTNGSPLGLLTNEFKAAVKLDHNFTVKGTTVTHSEPWSIGHVTLGPGVANFNHDTVFVSASNHIYRFFNRNFTTNIFSITPEGAYSPHFIGTQPSSTKLTNFVALTNAAGYLENNGSGGYSWNTFTGSGASNVIPVYVTTTNGTTTILAGINVQQPLGVKDIGGYQTLFIERATAEVPGYLHYSDFAAFAAKASTSITDDHETRIAALESIAAVTNIYIYEYALSDETTALTSGDKLTWRAPFALTVEDVRLSLSTGSSDGDVEVDILVNGDTIFDERVKIDEGEKTSVTSFGWSFSDPAIADDSEVVFTVVFPGVGAKGLKLKIYYTQQ